MACAFGLLSPAGAIEAAVMNGLFIGSSLFWDWAAVEAPTLILIFVSWIKRCIQESLSHHRVLPATADLKECGGHGVNVRSRIQVFGRSIL